MKVALFGMMQSGKSTLFSAISGKEPAPSGAARVEEAVVHVPDQRLDWLNGIYQPKKIVRGSVDCFDVPGFAFVDSSGRAAANRIISDIRSVDMYVLVVRAFAAPSVPPYRGEVNARRDIAELLSEFLLSDLEVVTNRIERLEASIKKNAKTIKQDQEELQIMLRLQTALEAEKPAATAVASEDELNLLKPMGLLTMKPLMVVVNVDEDQLKQQIDLSGTVDSSVPVVALSAKIEQELSQLDPESRAEFMRELGITEPAADKFVKSCYTAMGLISFLTVGPDEVRAWPIRRGSTALDAAGKIHSDIKRGFIRAETMAYNDLHSLGSEKAVRAAGKFRSEGKTYLVQDGDIIEFRFNV